MHRQQEQSPQLLVTAVISPGGKGRAAKGLFHTSRNLCLWCHVLPPTVCFSNPDGPNSSLLEMFVQLVLTNPGGLSLHRSIQ